MPGAFATGLGLVDRFCARVSGAALLGVAGLLLADVVGRSLGRPVFGAQDMAEMAMVVVIFGAVPLLEQRGGQIQVDLLRPFMSRRIEAGIGRLSHALAATLWFTLAWTLWQSAKLSSMLSLSTNILGLPKAPFQYLLAAFVMIAGLGAVLRTIRAQRAEHV
ncbi:TRAP transporter small permease [Paenirhodobacter populi]|uniref:TRAP transporter small permease protein n=1 Tax=Paenirhodobacter populi TaxID=2306993 RepID=A0A443JAF9_9RHOB|nr:TRAP transporter small permease subunit [Sinirhodobacter populi]RWR05225.1 TRAP transporter small permease [Sinirhodobacter populi]RWR17460.1 TRAP transporter small permease [Sinirhodobacter populi]